MTVFEILLSVMQEPEGITEFAKLISEIVTSCVACPARYVCRIKNDGMYFKGMCYTEIERYLKSELKLSQNFEPSCENKAHRDSTTDIHNISYTGTDWKLKVLLQPPETP